ncbi:MAG TPA: hypothetical protein VKU60_12440 [Chloroflexota bacterium]|nr:hypothetical protein [Chloroflexota bacterium]
MILPAASLSGIEGDVTVAVAAEGSSTASINAGGAARFSPNGTSLQIQVRDARGQRLTEFSAPVTAIFKPNGADLAMAQGDFSLLTAAYVVDADSPLSANPSRFPMNTLIPLLQSTISKDADSQALYASLTVLPSRLLVITAGSGYVQTISSDVAIWASFDPANDTILERKPQFSYLRVEGPQIGARLMVIDPENGSQGYVDALEVGPSGAPTRA